MRKTIIFLSVLLSLLVPAAALAQSSCPLIVPGKVLSAAQWNQCFQLKQDFSSGGGGSSVTASQITAALGYTPLNRGGDTSTGKQTFTPSVAGAAGINIGQGVAPTAPVNGDVWVTSSGFFAFINGATQGPFGAAGGTVTSVGLSVPTILTVAGSPVTGAGTLALGLANQNQNLVLAGPASGAATAPTFRGLVVADLPAAVVLTTNANIFTATQSTTVRTLTSGATVSWTWGAGQGNIYNLVLAGNVTTLANPGGTVAGTCVMLRVQQPAAGGPFTINGYGTAFKFPGGTHPVFSTAANAIDVLNMCGTGASEIETTAALNFS